MAAPPLDVNKEAVRVLAVAVGIREAARQTGLSESTVKSWSTREGWLDGTKPSMPLPKSMQPIASTASISPAVALQDAMQQLGKRTRLGYAKGLAASADTVAELPGQEVLLQAQQIAAAVKAASTLHGWGQDQSSTVRIDIHGMSTDTVIDIDATVIPDQHTPSAEP